MARAINAAALREIRDLVGISQRELARRCGVTQPAIVCLERSKNGASPELMRKLASALGVPLDAITVPLPEPEPASA